MSELIVLTSRRGTTVFRLSGVLFRFTWLSTRIGHIRRCCLLFLRIVPCSGCEFPTFCGWWIFLHCLFFFCGFMTWASWVRIKEEAAN